MADEERVPFLPYGRQTIEEEDVAAVVAALRSGWLTTGPAVEAFEAAFAESCGAAHAVAVSSGTAALHAAVEALSVGPGDEVIVPAITFAATASCALYQGARPVFADVDPETLLVDPESVAARVTPRTRAVIAVDYAGQPADYRALAGLCRERGIDLVADACHAVGARFGGKPVGSLARLSTFSFHPVKHLTTGEGGMVTTGDAALAERMRSFRNHGISRDFRARADAGTWAYEVTRLGWNYRLSDIQCALGLAQLRRLPAWVARRQALAARYDAALGAVRGVRPLARAPGRTHAFHLYVVRLDEGIDRAPVFRAMRAAGVGVNVHYLPVHLHPLYRDRLGTAPGLCPHAEAAYARILTLPMFPAMADADVDRVVAALQNAIAGA